MCDFCGCPQIEPFATLTDEHVTLDVLAEVLESSGDERDLDALRVTWDDHLAAQAGVRSLAEQLGLDRRIAVERDADTRLGALLAKSAPDPRELRRSIRAHVDAWEFEVFPQVVLIADPAELQEAAERTVSVRGTC